MGWSSNLILISEETFFQTWLKIDRPVISVFLLLYWSDPLAGVQNDISTVERLFCSSNTVKLRSMTISGMIKQSYTHFWETFFQTWLKIDRPVISVFLLLYWSDPLAGVQNDISTTIRMLALTVNIMLKLRDSVKQFTNSSCHANLLSYIIIP